MAAFQELSKGTKIQEQSDADVGLSERSIPRMFLNLHISLPLKLVGLLHRGCVGSAPQLIDGSSDTTRATQVKVKVTDRISRSKSRSKSR